jgi:pyruvate/2-oxoglutarate dehydrogenase complex dihydrolipoamide acyltransferase (E2) component
MAERTFAMPDLGEGLEEGEIVAWLVAEGDQIALNQPLVEVETAKATVEIPSPFAGRVVTLRGVVGDAIPVGSPLVTFAVADGPDGSEGDVPPPSSSGSTAPSTTVTATPAVRRLAKERGIDLSTITGTGPNGRITVEDLDAAGGGTLDIEGVEVITPIRREIARRLTEVAAIPQVTTFRTVDCTELDAFRRELEVSPLPVFVAALVRVCADHPLINSSWRDDGIHASRSVHVGIATDTERGLMVPVLRNAHAVGIGSVAAEIRRLAEAARGGHLHAEDLRGATISVSNTGSYGSEAGTPLLNPGNAVTIALGVIQPRALVVEGEIVGRPACTLSMTFDHRVMDGATAGQALTDLVALLQDGERLRDLPT